LETFFLANFLASTEKIKSNATKATVHREHKDEINTKELKPGLDASYDYDIQPGNATDLFPKK